MQTYPTGYAESHHIAEQIFREILPRHGMAVREEQIALCHEVLDTLYNKEISLCEAGVGTGKTLALSLIHISCLCRLARKIVSGIVSRIEFPCEHRKTLHRATLP